MASLEKCIRSCNAVDDKICVPIRKVINVKVLNMITWINEAKILIEHIPCDCKCKFISKIYNSNQKWNNDTCQCECKKYCTCKKDYSWNHSRCIYENSSCLKRIVDNSVIVFDEIINATNIVSINVKNAVTSNLTKTIPIKSRVLF